MHAEQPRNPGTPLDLHAVEARAFDDTRLGSEAREIAARFDPSPDDRTRWLLRAVACMDLTTLSGDDTPQRVRALCARARQPMHADFLERLGAADLTVAAVCVYHAMIAPALAALNGSGIPVSAVAAGFPHGLSPLSARVAEIEASVAAGATEIDVVIARHLALSADWPALYEEIRTFREACGTAHMKVILATGELGSLSTVACASQVAMQAGADFIKTSTGKEKVNATLPAALIMLREIRGYHAATGFRVGFKPAGGISTAALALDYLALVRAELSDEWITPALLRFGASSLLDDIEANLSA
ncbi:deoxyribose-phosphate aldolase [Roseovarius aestuariivivens]|uniref:deoxyribose-phosphate aldolase n=1 Tax=Roseovarius aestuariivivens TaxID=1888910 RepID=UPI001080DEBF|nr:deoxyribose-phosphate aldolase [Roseovarius aestuariivivens]